MFTFLKAPPYLLTALLLVCSYSALSQNQTVYVDDVVYVPMRSCPGTNCKIIKSGVKSGTPLTKLETDEENKWTKVRTLSSDALEGWVPNQFLSDQPSARARLAKALETIARLEKQRDEALGIKQQVTDESVSLEKQLVSARNAKLEAEKELAQIRTLSAGAIELQQRHQKLVGEHRMLAVERDALAAENENLKNDLRISFLFYGAGLVVLGMFLSVIIPALKPKKKYGEWS